MTIYRKQMAEVNVKRAARGGDAGDYPDPPEIRGNMHLDRRFLGVVSGTLLK
jgi:hypothetical protein